MQWALQTMWQDLAPELREAGALPIFSLRKGLSFQVLRSLWSVFSHVTLWGPVCILLLGINWGTHCQVYPGGCRHTSFLSSLPPVNTQTQFSFTGRKWDYLCSRSWSKRQARASCRQGLSLAPISVLLPFTQNPVGAWLHFLTPCVCSVKEQATAL